MRTLRSTFFIAVPFIAIVHGMLVAPVTADMAVGNYSSAVAWLTSLTITLVTATLLMQD